MGHRKDITVSSFCIALMMILNCYHAFGHESNGFLPGVDTKKIVCTHCHQSNELCDHCNKNHTVIIIL